MRWLLQCYPGDAFAQFVISVLVQATVVMLLALLVSRLFLRRRAALRYAVWVCALVCVLLSPIAALVGNYTGISLVRIPVSSARSPVHATGLESPAPAVVASGEKQATVTKQAPKPAHSDIAGPTESRAGAVSRVDIMRAFAAVVLTVWAIGAAFLCVRLIFGFGVHAALRRAVMPIEMEDMEHVYNDVRKTLGITRLAPAGTSVLVNSPVSIGIFNPLVILPQSLPYALKPEELRDVLIHEYAHVVQRDHVVNLLARIVRILLWVHPLLGVLNRELSTAREEVCDNYVLHGTEPASYSRTLLGLAEHTTIFHRTPASVGLAHPRWKLEDRVAGILDGNRLLKTRISSLVLGATVTAFLFAVIAAAACRVVSAEPVAIPEDKLALIESAPTVFHSMSRADMEQVENEIKLCRAAAAKLAIGEIAEQEFENRIKKSVKALRSFGDVSHHLIELLADKSDKDWEEIITKLLRGTSGLITEFKDVDTIVFKEKGKKTGSVKVTTDKNGKPVIIDSEEYELLRDSPTPEKLLAAIAYDKTVKRDLRIHAARALGSRGTTGAVEILVKLLNMSKGALFLELARTLRRLTGEKFGPAESSTLEEAEKALGEWNSWWEENKIKGIYSFDR